MIGKERKILLYQKQKEWTDLHAEFTEDKTNTSNDISKMVEEYDKSVNDMMWDHGETYRATKKNLELDFQVNFN